MNGKRARAIRRLEAEQRAQRWAHARDEVLADVGNRLAAARAGGPGWRARALTPTVHLGLDGGDAIEAQRLLKVAGERLGRRRLTIDRD